MTLILDRIRRQKNRDRQYGRKTYHKLREGALLRIGKGKIQCVNCGCTDRRFIEINHMNGGAKKHIFQ